MRVLLPFFVAAFLAISHLSLAQTRTIKGKVTDDNNKPLPGASVLVKGSSAGTSTKDDGTFSLNVNNAGPLVLVVSSAGHTAKDVVVNAGAIDVQIKLAALATNLEDVVVISSLGLSRKQKSVTYSSQSVDPDRLTEARDVNLINGLAGKVAGIQVTTTGQPGSSSRVILRGDNSITGNSQPLWVVDGVPIANNSGETSNNLDVGNGAADLNPDDIESIEILKGPNAAALYGSRAANGAILVTTKKAKVGNNLGISMNQNTMWYSVSELPAFQNVYGEGNNMRLVTNANNIFPGTNGVNMGINTQSWGAPMLGQPYNTYAGKPHGYTPQPGNIQDLYKTSVTNASNVALAKADANGSFRLSYTFTKSNDVMQKQNLGTRHNLNFYGTRKLSNFLTVDTRVLYTNQKWQNRTTRNPANDGSSPMAAYLYLPRSIDLDAMKPWADGNGNAIRYGAVQDGFDNVYWNINENRNQDDRNRIIGGVMATMQLLKKLKLRTQVTGDLTYFTQYQYKELGGRQTQNGFYSNDMRNEQNWNYEALFMHNNTFGDFSLNVNLGFNQAIFSARGRQASISSLLVHDMPSISNTNSAQVASEFYTRSKVQSIFGSATLGYKDFLFLDVTGRNDWSSTLPEDAWSFFYPSVGASFVFTEFLNNKSLLSYGKIRASYAKVGNAAQPYQLINTFSYGGLFLGNPYLNYTNSMKNSGLKPEQIVSKEIGLDLNFFRNTMKFSATAYQSNSTNQILNAATPTETGFQSRVVNAGEMQNRGLELSLNATVLQTKKLQWTVLANWSTNKNEVLSMVPGVNRLQIGQNLGITTNAVVGQPFGVLMGSIPYRSNDTILLNGNKTGRILQEANQLVGSPRPYWIGSVGTTVRYAGFDFSVLATVKWGGKIYCASMGRANFYGNSVASLLGRDDFFFSTFILNENDNERKNIGQTVGAIVVRYADSSRPKGYAYANAYYPLLNAQGQPVLDKNGRQVPGEKAVVWLSPQAIAADNVTGNTELVTFDASCIKISELVMGYTVPQKMLGKSFIKNARIAFVGRNLWTIFKNTPIGIDPEAAINSSSGGFGIEAGGSFPYAQYGFDLKLSF